MRKLRRRRPNRSPRSYSTSPSFDKGSVKRLAFILILSCYILFEIMRSDGGDFGMEMANTDPHAEIEKSGFFSLLSELTGERETKPPFQASKYNYSLSALNTMPESNYTLPPPKKTSQSTIVIVLSARQNFDKRKAIRETWAKGNDNVYFVVGGPEPENKDDRDLSNPGSVSSLLKKEQEMNRDIIDCVEPDTYKSLPYKMHFAVRWVMQNLENVNWIVKVDDDVIARVKLLDFFVLRKFNPNHPMVIGRINIGAPVHRVGKWAEDPLYQEATYPPWPYGSSGYIISKPIAQYLAGNDFYYYQGEDAGLGIWLDESPLQVHFLDTPELFKEKECHEKYYIIGHNLAPDDIRACFSQIGDDVPERKHIISFHAGRKDQHPGKINHNA